jgi:integrase
MARRAKVNYWPSRRAFGVWHIGTQHILAEGEDDRPDGPVYCQAIREYGKLVAGVGQKGTDRYLLDQVFNAYREQLGDQAGRLAQFETLVQPFADHMSGKMVCQLDPLAIDKWLAGRSTWAAATRRKFVELLSASLNYAVSKDLIDSNPVVDARGRYKIECPDAALRGDEAIMDDALMDLLIEEAYGRAGQRDALQWLLRLLRATGARPGELIHATARNVVGGRIVHRWNTRDGYVWKNARKTKKDRQISLPRELAEYAQGQALLHPAGPIFRSAYGKPWDTCNLCMAWKRLLRKKPVAKYLADHGIREADLVPYNFRHSWITRYVNSTGDVWGAAKMCGTSVKQIEQRYCHTDADAIHNTYLRYMESSGQR